MVRELGISQGEVKKTRIITRRKSLGLIGGALFGIPFLSLSCGDRNEPPVQNPAGSPSRAPSLAPLREQNILPAQPKTIIPIIARQPYLVEIKNSEPFDIEYVKSLIQELKKPNNLETAAKLNALKENATYLELKDSGGGSALKICESGYYLTAAHIVLDEESTKDEQIPIKTRVSAYRPSTGTQTVATQFIADFQTDLAIVYAPTGLPRRKVQGLTIVDTPLETNRRLWLLGMELVLGANNSASMQLHIPSGMLDPDIAANGKFKLIKGMRPFGGSSGGSIIDLQGNIVAVESGAYSSIQRDVAPTYDQYTHAIVSPMTNLAKLLDRPVQSFPQR